MQRKRSKRTRIRAAKVTAGHGHKKKNRGAGNRGGRGKSQAGKRGDAKIMKVTKGVRDMGKHGFTSLNKQVNTITLSTIDQKAQTWLKENIATSQGNKIAIDLTKMGYDKVLSKGDITYAVDLTVANITTRAKEKIEKAGGSIIVK